MTDDEAQKLREEMEGVKAANAFLYLALEATANMALEIPRIFAESIRSGSAREDDVNSVRRFTDQINEMLNNAHKCIWDEDGKPR